MGKLDANLFSFRGMFLHAWDLADRGTDQVIDWMNAAGLNTLCLAGTYHNGWFIHPHNSRHRAFFTEGDVCYFHPRESFYKTTKLRPTLSLMVNGQDWFAEVARRLEPGQRLVSWTVGTNNLRLGLAHPELSVQNVYGDRLPHALCPANDDVREYLKSLIRDLATHYPLWGVQLEAFGWMGFAHDHHHERDLVGLTPMEQDLMGLCVCPACAQKATGYGVSVKEVKRIIKDTLDGVFREAPQRPKGHPQSILELEAASEELKKFQAWRQKFLVSLLSEIKQESLAGSDCRLLLQTEFDPALADIVDGFGCASYQQRPAETLNICRHANLALPRRWDGLLQCFVQLGIGIPGSEQELADIIAAVQAGGCNGINFYNLSESPPKMLEWLAQIMPQFVPKDFPDAISCSR